MTRTRTPRPVSRAREIVEALVGVACLAALGLMLWVALP